MVGHPILFLRADEAIQEYETLQHRLREVLNDLPKAKVAADRALMNAMSKTYDEMNDEDWKTFFKEHQDAIVFGYTSAEPIPGLDEPGTPIESKGKSQTVPVKLDMTGMPGHEEKPPMSELGQILFDIAVAPLRIAQKMAEIVQDDAKHEKVCDIHHSPYDDRVGCQACLAEEART